MKREEKLATLILLEAEALKECKEITSGIALAEELTRDAIALAQLVNNKKEERMRKVIDIMTKQPLEELPFSKEAAAEVLEHLMKYKEMERPSMVMGEHIILRDLFKFIESNSGMTVMEVLEKRKA